MKIKIKEGSQKSVPVPAKETEDIMSDQTESSSTLSQTSFDIFAKLTTTARAAFARNNLILVSMDGLQTGVPTLTTPTLTPTTLRSIEETFQQLTSDPINTPYQAGFKPPPLAPMVSAAAAAAAAASPAGALNNFNSSNVPDFGNALLTESEDSQGSWNPSQYNEDNSATDTSSAATDSTSNQNGISMMSNANLSNLSGSNNSANDFSVVIAAAKAAANFNKHSNNNNVGIGGGGGGGGILPPSAVMTTPNRRGGGRRPTKSANISPEEEEKRRIRRERNKLAAARCRKRRVDQTNELLDEVALLERKRESMNQEIEYLTTAKRELEMQLEAHRPNCQKMRDNQFAVNAYNSLIITNNNNSNNNNNNNNNNNSNSSNTGNNMHLNDNNNAKVHIIGRDAALNSTGRSNSPIDLKPINIDKTLLEHIKPEPLDGALDSDCSYNDDGSPLPKRMLLDCRKSTMARLPNIAMLTASLATSGGNNTSALNTPIVTTAPGSFEDFAFNNSNGNADDCEINLDACMGTVIVGNRQKPRPNSFSSMPRTRTYVQDAELNDSNKPRTEIQGVPIQTPSTGIFNFDSLMDGGTGLTPIAAPVKFGLMQNNRHPLELPTPTSESSKLVSL